jgi:UrcA family protein
MKKTFVLAATALLAVSLAGMAHATTTVRRNMQQQVVSYADLNLETEADAATLLSRIKSAARKVCGLDHAIILPFAMQYELQVCAKEAIARAINDVNAPLLTASQIVVRNDE